MKRWGGKREPFNLLPPSFHSPSFSSFWLKSSQSFCWWSQVEPSNNKSLSYFIALLAFSTSSSFARSFLQVLFHSSLQRTQPNTKSIFCHLLFPSSSFYSSSSPSHPFFLSWRLTPSVKPFSSLSFPSSRQFDVFSFFLIFFSLPSFRNTDNNSVLSFSLFLLFSSSINHHQFTPAKYFLFPPPLPRIPFISFKEL